MREEQLIQVAIMFASEVTINNQLQQMYSTQRILTNQELERWRSNRQMKPNGNISGSTELLRRYMVQHPNSANFLRHIEQMSNIYNSANGLPWLIATQLMAQWDPDNFSVYRGFITLSTITLLFEDNCVEGLDVNADPPQKHREAHSYLLRMRSLLQNPRVGLTNVNFLTVDLFISWVGQNRQRLRRYAGNLN